MQNLPISIIMNKEVSKDGVFIGDCPNEILSTILLNLPHGTSLVEISLVHERFRRVALPMLYNSIRLRADQTTDYDYSSKRMHELPAGLVFDPKGEPSKSFPTLCIHVKKLSLKVLDTNWYTHAGGHRKLLELLPRVKELTLDPPPRIYGFPMSDQLTTMRLNLPFEFARFRNPKVWPAYLDLEEYLSKPSLRGLQFNSEYDRLHYKIVHTGNTRNSNVTDLRLMNWLPEDVHVLSTVLRSIKRLENFVIDVDGLWSGPRPRYYDQRMKILKPHDYSPLLQLHDASLEQVIITYRRSTYFDASSISLPNRALPVMGSLSSYPKLKRLAIPEHFLITGEDIFMYEILPPNLEELQIQVTGVRDWDIGGDGADELPYYGFRMEAIALDKNESLPRLKRVVLWIQTDDTYVYTLDAIRDPGYPYKHGFSGAFKQHMVEISDRLHEVNVKFEVVLTCKFKKTPFAEYLYLQ